MEHLDEMAAVESAAANGIAVTSRRFLTLLAEDKMLFTLDQFPIGDVTVLDSRIRALEYKRWDVLRRRSADARECELRVGDRTLTVSDDYDGRLQLALSRLPGSGRVLGAQIVPPQARALSTTHKPSRVAPVRRASRKGGYALIVAGTIALWFGLPETGAATVPWAITAGGVLIAFGIAVIIITRRRFRRAVKQALGTGSDERGAN